MFELRDKTLRTLIERADQSTRLRKSFNIHKSHQEPIQRLCNAICVNSYIRPHRHSLDPKHELLVAIKGIFALIVFSDSGNPESYSVFGSEKYLASDKDSYAVEVPPFCWHTVIALAPRSVLLEIKEGPFDHLVAKEYAPWSPLENSIDAKPYLRHLRATVLGTSTVEIFDS